MPSTLVKKSTSLDELAEEDSLLRKSKKTQTYASDVGTTQMALPGFPSMVQEVKKKRPWPDVSAYGLHFGIFTFPGGERRLIMVDDEGAWSDHAKTWGFKESRWPGLWIKKSGTKLSIPRFGILFPGAITLELTDDEIISRLDNVLVSRPSKRLSQVDARTGFGRLSWHPKQRIAEQDPVNLRVSPVSAMAQVRYLGLNYLNQHIYEAGDGHRYAKIQDIIVAKEENETDEPSPLFLRKSKNDPDGSLILCATGIVREIESGSVLHASDFDRYLESVYGPYSVADNPKLAEDFSVALDAALIKCVISSKTGNARIDFSNALKLHEGRPSYYRNAGSLPTPLPISLVMQFIASATTEIETPKYLDITSHGSEKPTESHSWNLENVAMSPLEYLQPHDITLAGIYGKKIQSEIIDGISIDRADHKAVLESLKLRSPNGSSVFLISSGQTPGKLDSDFKRVLAKIGTDYDVASILDIDPKMISPGNTDASRLLIIGAKKASPDHGFSIPLSVPVAYDYNTLWEWAERNSTSVLAKFNTFGDDVGIAESREENRWQAPYIPSSQVSEPKSMSPRNLLGPVRKALSRVSQETGLSVDDYVAKKLQWNLIELAQYLDAEQVDAVCLGVFAMDKKQGIVEADQTGIGKGRVLAAMMRYAILEGKPILFMTEKSELFNDIYRDIEDIGSTHLFMNPIIMNADIVIRDSDNNEIGHSFKKAELSKFLRSTDVVPPFVMATYSQFNRKPSELSSMKDHRIAVECEGLIKSGANRREILDSLNKLYEKSGGLALDDSRITLCLDSNEDAIATLKNILSAETQYALSVSPLRELAHQLSLRLNTDEELLKLINLKILDNSGLKQEWINSDNHKNTFVIMDESHVAAGPKSQTNLNLKKIVATCDSIVHSSATFAKGTENYAVYQRIFPSTVSTFGIGDVLSKGGAPLQEILCSMLAEDGRLIRREHDLSNLEFQMSVDTDRIDRNTLWANSLADILSSMAIVSGEIEEYVSGVNKDILETMKAAAVANGFKDKKIKVTSGIKYSNFSSGFYNLNRTFMMMMVADVSADAAIKALKEGRKPVITVENTMESIIKELDSQYLGNSHSDDFSLEFSDSSDDSSSPKNPTRFGAIDGDDFSLLDLGIELESDSTELEVGKRLGRAVGFKDILTKYVDGIFYGWEWKDIWSNDDNALVRRKVRKNLKQPGMEAAEAAIKELISNFPDVPLSPLDTLRDRVTKAGFSIDEISGRELSIVRNADGTDSIRKMPPRSKQVIKDSFNSGKLNAIILSKAGSTGISLHASETFNDQSQRELIELQPAADISQRLQFWGRVNRKGQVCPPIIRMTSSGLPGETRLKTMQNAHLRKMSANISGNADNSALDDNAPDILNNIGNEVCFRWIESNPYDAKLLGINLNAMTEKVELKSDGSVSLSGTRFVDLLTSRILLLNVEKQKSVYENITTEFKALVEQYELEGRNPLKADSHDIKAIRGKQAIVETVYGTDESVFNKTVMATELHYTETLDGISTEDLISECETGRQILIDQFGSENWMSVLSKKIDKCVELRMPAMLSMKYSTVEQALADSNHNAIKNLAIRSSFIQSNLHQITPGSTFCLEYTEESPQRFLVVGLSVPEDNVSNPSAYTLKVRSKSSRKIKSITLSSLMRAENAFSKDIIFGHQNYSALIKPYFASMRDKIEYVGSRVVLEDNLFRASQIATTRGMGQAVTYTDNSGIWHHAILMPENINLERINQLPLDITHPELMSALLCSEEQNCVITNSFKKEERIYDISFSGNVVTILTPSTMDSVKWMTGNEEINSTLLSAWTGSRSLRTVTVNNEKIDVFCVAFIKAAQQAGVPIIVSGRFRKWANDFSANARKNSNTQVSATVDLDDIDRQLEAMTL